MTETLCASAEPPTSREEVIAAVAVDWLARHPEITTTAPDIAKSLNQLLTVLFNTRAERRRTALTDHARAVLRAAGVDVDAFASARAFTKSADMPAAYGTMFAAVAEVLAPLAAAVQLARIPVTDAATRMLQVRESGGTPTRRELRGYVVGRVRPHAQQVHASVGSGRSAEEYLALLLEDVDSLAAAVVTGAARRRALPTELSPAGAERLRVCAATHGRRLMHAAAGRYGAQADDIVGGTWLKLAEAFRVNAHLDIGYAYVHRTMESVANDHFARGAVHTVRDIPLPEGDRVEYGVEDSPPVDTVDLVVRCVLDAAQRLECDADAESVLAGRVLRIVLLADPAQRDPRRAAIAVRIRRLCSDGWAGDIIADTVRAAAHALTEDRTSADRVAALAIRALRS